MRVSSLNDHCGCERSSCMGEIVEISTAAARELYIRVDSAAACPPGSAAWRQADALYGCLPWILKRAGAAMSDVVFEKVFCRSLHDNLELLWQARHDIYRQHGVTDDRLPLTTFLQQPPCVLDREFELQAYAVVPQPGSTTRVRSLPALFDGPAAKLVEINGFQHLYAAGITAEGPYYGRARSFREQCEIMFDKAGELLRQHGVSFSHVLRTWIYLQDMERDYPELNESRNDFFADEQPLILPASTGIGAQLASRRALCGMDFYALVNPDRARVEVIHSHSLNEALAYGSAFSRGIKVCLPEKTVLHLSGTAAIDEQGQSVGIGDLEGQIERMLLNVEDLLTSEGATFKNVVQAVTYLKSAESLPVFQEILAHRGLPQIPNSIVQAEVCRPELLCEMEAVAVISHESERRMCLPTIES